MKDTTEFSSASPIGARIGAICLFMPPVAIVAIVLLGSTLRTGDLALALTSLTLAGIFLFTAIWRSAVHLRIGQEEVIVGFSPLWKTRIRVNEIVEISIVTVDPYVQYRGWGIKGSVRSEMGRLYSAGGTHSVRVRTASRRTYLIAFDDSVTAHKAAAELTEVCCPSSVGTDGDGRRGSPEA